MIHFCLPAWYPFSMSGSFIMGVEMSSMVGCIQCSGDHMFRQFHQDSLTMTSASLYKNWRRVVSWCRTTERINNKHQWPQYGPCGTPDTTYQNVQSCFYISHTGIWLILHSIKFPHWVLSAGSALNDCSPIISLNAFWQLKICNQFNEIKDQSDDFDFKYQL